MRYAISRVKKAHPGLVFIVEVYEPSQYRNFISIGFDYCDGSSSCIELMKSEDTRRMKWDVVNLLERFPYYDSSFEFAIDKATLVYFIFMIELECMIYFEEHSLIIATHKELHIDGNQQAIFGVTCFISLKIKMNKELVVISLLVIVEKQFQHLKLKFFFYQKIK